MKKQYYEDNREKVCSLQKKYYDENRDVIIKNKNNYEKKTDVNFRLTRNKRRRIHHALNGKSKSSSTLEILGIDVETYRKWIEFQLTSDMTGDNIEIDHMKTICMLDISKDKE